MIPRCFVVYHLQNITRQRRIPTVTLIQTYHVLCEKHQASAVTNWERKTKVTKNVVERKDVFDTQQLEESLKMSRKYKKYGKSDKLKKSGKQLKIKDIISEVIMMKHLIQLSRLQEIRRKEQKSNQAADRKWQITRQNLVLSGKEVLLKTKGKGHHLLKKPTRRNKRFK